MLDVRTVLPPPITVRTDEEAEAALQILWDAPAIAYDTETTGLRRGVDHALFLALSDGKQRWCVGPEQLDAFCDLMEAPDKRLIAHIANFDAWMLAKEGIHVYRTPNRRYCTATMHLLLDDTLPHSLDYVAWTLCGIHKRSFSEEFPEVKKKGVGPGEVLMSLWKTDPERVSHYASLDAYATFPVHDILCKKLGDEEIWDGFSVLDYYETWELPFTDVLLSMEMQGISVNLDKLKSLTPKFQEEMYEISKWFSHKSGRMVKTNNKEAHNFFYKKLGRPPVKYTGKKNKPSLDKETLKVWANSGCNASEKMLRWRQLEKLCSTYLQNLYQMATTSTDGRIHTTFNQHVARTGRLSSSDPNLQNQPPEVRDAFIAAPGKRLLVMDYGQVEWRLVAHLSQDERMMSDIFAGKDAHCSTASALFGASYEDLMEAKDAEEPTEPQLHLLKLRKFAKTLNFGILYGEGPYKLAQQLDISIDEAKTLLRKFADTYPQLFAYFRRVIKTARKTGNCYTILGRPRRLTTINSDVRALAAAGERKAKNSPAQGSASDIIKAAMINLMGTKPFQDGSAAILLQVHDELVIEADEELEHSEEFDKLIEWNVLYPLGLDKISVPLTIDKGWSDNWLEGKG